MVHKEILTQANPRASAETQGEAKEVFLQGSAAVSRSPHIFMRDALVFVTFSGHLSISALLQLAPSGGS